MLVTGPAVIEVGPGCEVVIERKGNHRGTQHKHTQFVRELVATEREDIVKKVVAQAKSGCVQSQALFLRFLGGAAPRYVRDPFNLPRVANAREAIEQISVITTNVAHGVLDLEASQALIHALRTFVSCYAVAELEDKVIDADALEPLDGEAAE
jgi:hypothetical protein